MKIRIEKKDTVILYLVQCWRAKRSLARTEQIIFIADLQAPAFPERKYKSSGEAGAGSHHALGPLLIIY